MASKYIVDTHALVWYLESSPRLGLAAKAILDDPVSELVFPMIALSEAVDIVDKGRTKIASVPILLNRVLGDPRIELLPLDLDTLQTSLHARTVPEMHDRLIAAAGLLLQQQGENVAILTKDVSIANSALLPVIWD
ncbi:MAG: PIN domain-containing protein [Acidobacteria bacterium]|nr:PIN domain-containing protein [Acidobacteriota bacterium]